MVGESLVYAGVGQLEVAAGPGGEDGAVGEDGVEAGGGQRPGLALALGVARGHHPHLGMGGHVSLELSTDLQPQQGPSP